MGTDITRLAALPLFHAWKDALFRPIHGAREEFLSIDLLRGVSALSILIFHFDHFAMGGIERGPTIAELRDIPILRLASVVIERGGLAVMLFWMISGFVFMNVYAGTRPHGWKFFVNRFSRLYPLHFVTLLFVAAIQFASIQHLDRYLIYQWNDLYHFILQIFFASEWGFAEGRSFNGPIWSVSIEVLIYAVFFLYIRFARVNLFTLGLCFLIFLSALHSFPNSSLALCGVYFFGGAGIYVLYDRTPPRLRRITALAAVVAAGTLSVALSWGGLALPLTIWLLAIFGLMLLALAILENSPLRAAFRRTRFIGEITYSSYLWHSPLQMAFLFGAGMGFWTVEMVINDWFVLAYVGVVVMVSYASYRLIERPAQRWLRNLLLRRPSVDISGGR